MNQEIELLLNFNLALYFINFGKIAPALGFNEVMRVNRPLFNARKCNEIAERKLVHDVDNVLFGEWSVNGHRFDFPLLTMPNIMEKSTGVNTKPILFALSASCIRFFIRNISY